jgi:hypothetical protein
MQDLINQLVELTGASEEDVQSYLDQLDLDTTYNIIDASRRGKVDELKAMLSDLVPSENNVKEASMSKDKNKNTIKLDIPKPRDPMARELAKGQYQPKRTPSKRELLNKTDRKHKGSQFESEEIAESFMSMAGIPSIKKMLTLAGRPFDDEEVEQAVEDYMSDTLGNIDGMRIDDIKIPTGTTLKPGLVNGFSNSQEDDFDLELDSIADVSDEPIQQDTAPTTTAIAAIHNAASIIKMNLADIKLGQFSEVKELINELNSAIDLLANQVKGQ